MARPLLCGPGSTAGPQFTLDGVSADARHCGSHSPGSLGRHSDTMHDTRGNPESRPAFSSLLWPLVTWPLRHVTLIFFTCKTGIQNAQFFMGVCLRCVTAVFILVELVHVRSTSSSFLLPLPSPALASPPALGFLPIFAKSAFLFLASLLFCSENYLH